MFENESIIKSEKYYNLDSNEFVTIYYDALTDSFAIVDLKTNFLLEFGIASEVKYTEIIADNFNLNNELSKSNFKKMAKYSE